MYLFLAKSSGSDIHFDWTQVIRKPPTEPVINRETVKKPMKPFISLEDGEPEYRTPEHINQAMIKALELGLTHYGDYKHMIKTT